MVAFVTVPALAEPAPSAEFPPVASPSATPSAAGAPAPPPSSAPPAPPAPPPPLAPAGAGPDAASWEAELVRAREDIVRGDYAGASRRLTLLFAWAPTPVDEARARELAYVSSALFARSGSPKLTLSEDRTRRTSDEISSLYAASVAYGLGSGAWLAFQTEPGSAAGAILPAFAFAGVSAGAVALIDSGTPFRYGVPQGIISGASLGLMEGLTWTLWNQARTHHRDEWSEKTMATVIWGVTTVGAGLGGLAASSAPTTPGRSSFVGSGGLWTGLVSGLAGAALASDGPQRDDTALLSAALGLNVGAGAAMLAASRVNPSVSRVRYLDLGGAVGMISASGLYLSADDDVRDERAFLGVTAAGSVAGLAVAWLLTSGMAPSLPPDDRASPEQHASDRPLVASLALAPEPFAGGAGLGVRGALW